MAKFVVEIEMGNAAFEDAPEYEVSRILHELSKRVTTCSIKDGGRIALRDINGNNVGEAKTIEA